MKVNMSKIIPRNSKGYYKIDEESYVSVTTALQIIFKKNLQTWVKKQVAMSALKAKKGATVEEVLKDADKIKRTAASRGRKIHKILENTKTLVKTGMYDSDIVPYLDSYNKFLNSMRFGTIGREVMCYSKKYKYAGTADLLIRTFFGEVWLIDYKTSNFVHDSYQLQLAAYKQAVEEMGIVKKVDKMFVLHLKDNGEFDLMEVVDDFETFKNVLSLWQWANNDSIKFIFKNQENVYTKKQSSNSNKENSKG